MYWGENEAQTICVATAPAVVASPSGRGYFAMEPRRADNVCFNPTICDSKPVPSRGKGAYIMGGGEQAMCVAAAPDVVVSQFPARGEGNLFWNQADQTM
jgi:hypothetical protein